MQPEAKTRLAQVHMSFAPQTVASGLSADPHAPLWQQVPSQWLALAPPQWSDQRVIGFEMQVARDAESLAFRMQWEDDTPQGSPGNLSSDTALLRFSPFDGPQFFGPGRDTERKEAWEWSAEEGDFEFAPLGVEVRSSHADDKYTVVFLRKLNEAPERVGMSDVGASLAFEIRNGAAGDPARALNITVWHLLLPSL